MNTPRIVGLPVVLLGSLILSACGDGDSTGPGNTGALRVTATTTGADPPDRYRVAIIGTGGQPVESEYVGSNSSVLFPNLTPGPHRIQLFGIESNCAVAGDNPRTVSVIVGQTTSSTFNVACVAVTVRLEVWTSSCGSHIDQDGYTISIDGAVRGAIGVNATDTLYVEGLGEHTVSLGDVTSECVVCDGNPRVFDVTRTRLRQRTFFPILCNPDLTGEIAFVRFDPSTYDQVVTFFFPNIHLLSPDHKCPTNLTKTLGAEFGDPALSPDGDKIAYIRYPGSSGDLYVMNADGTGLRPLVFPYESASQPSWSPDGNRVAFAKRPHQGDIRDSDIYLIDARGTGLVNLTGHLGTDDTAPAWSPDGDRIVFASAGDLFVIDIDGTNLTRLTQDPERYDDPAWSPDAARIAFTCEREGNNEICVMNADGTGLLQLTNDPAEDRDPVWSPDGAKIAFTRDDTTVFFDNFDHTTVFFMNADGSDVKPFIDRAGAPTWSRARP